MRVRFRFIDVIVAMTTNLLLCLPAIFGQEPGSIKLNDPTGTSDLSSALPAGEWAEVEKSVDRGLSWLAAQQAADGSFGESRPGQPALTSFAVMAFLSRGHQPEDGQYGRQLTRAIDFILSTQKPDGSFSALPWGPPWESRLPPHTVAYNHPIAGLTLGEVYGIAAGRQSKGIQQAIEKALVFTRGEQIKPKSGPREIGAWRYPFPQPPTGKLLPVEADLSVTGWNLMFLRSARNAGFDVPPEHVAEALRFVEECYMKLPSQRRTGVFLYRVYGNNPLKMGTFSMTGAGMLSLQLGGKRDSEMVQVAAQWLADHPYPEPDRIQFFYYGSYYCSQAMAQAGGEYWDAFYPGLVERMLGEQQPNGSWPDSAVKEEDWGSCYSTALAILSLTPPYQLLPIYQR